MDGCAGDWYAMRSTVATIDLDALAWNYHVLRARTQGVRMLAMVKANAYGHGMVGVSRVLQHLGVDMLGTAFVSEARVLRDAGITIPIIVLTQVEPHEADEAIALNLITVVGDVSQATALAQAARARNTTAEVHLYIDTGMSRDGVRPHDAVTTAEMLQSTERLRCTGICTHFATADDPHNPFMKEQLSTFERVVEQCAAAGCSFATVHAANTGALWQSSETHFSLVRPGLALYGYSSAEAHVATLRPVMRVSSNVVSLRRAWPGDTVSYGRRYMLTEEATIATVPIGYGDGYMRALTGSASCLIRGKRYPVVGTICMDEIMVNVGSDPVELGDEVVLLGTQTLADRTGAIDLEELATWAGTIPYEITTAVSARVPRLFTGELASVAQSSSL